MENITGRDSLEQILDGIMAGKAAGFEPIKINMVAMRGVNDHEIDAMVEFCLLPLKIGIVRKSNPQIGEGMTECAPHTLCIH